MGLSNKFVEQPHFFNLSILLNIYACKSADCPTALLAKR